MRQLLSDIEKLGCGCHTRAPSVAAVTPGHPNQSLCVLCVGVQRRELYLIVQISKKIVPFKRARKFMRICGRNYQSAVLKSTNYSMWSRIAGPRRTFQLRLSSLRTKPVLTNALLLFSQLQLQLRCSTSNSGPHASPPRNELSAKWAAKNVIDFGRADQNLSNNTLASYFQSKKRKSKVVRRRRRKTTKKLDRPAEGVHAHLRRSVVGLLSLGCGRSLSKSVVFSFFKFLASFFKLAFYYPRSLPFFFSTKPCRTKLFSGPLEASRKRPVDGASTERWPSWWSTRFSCILVLGRRKALISLTVFETKNEMRVHTQFVRTRTIFRVAGVIVRMPYLPSWKVRWEQLDMPRKNLQNCSSYNFSYRYAIKIFNRRSSLKKKKKTKDLVERVKSLLLDLSYEVPVQIFQNFKPAKLLLELSRDFWLLISNELVEKSVCGKLQVLMMSRRPLFRNHLLAKIRALNVYPQIYLTNQWKLSSVQNFKDKKKRSSISNLELSLKIELWKLA